MRKVVQIMMAGDRPVALCDDGTMWLGNHATGPGVAWQKMVTPPQPQPGVQGS